MKTEVIRILEKRVEDFEKIHHSYEAREVRSAIDTIKRLIPPELFAIHDVSQHRELFVAIFDKMTDDDIQECNNGFADRVFDRLSN